MVSHPVQDLHRKAALTTICQQFNFRDVDDRKGWFNKTNQSEVDWVISLGRVTYWAAKPEKTDNSARSGWGLELRKQWLHQGP
jgi:hypothetical protein